MKAKHFLIFVFILTFVVSLSGCSAIDSVFATPTPTATNTPAATATSTATATATSTATLVPTPKPPLTLEGCALSEDCPEAIKIVSLIDVKMESGVQYPVTVPFDQKILLQEGWIAKDQLTLDQNLEHMTPIFEIDGQPYLLDELMSSHTTKVSDTEEGMGKWISVTVSGWRVNETHTIRIGWVINDKITDGWDNYEKGTDLTREYLVRPARLPTSTPTTAATATRTPLPPTPTASCPLTDAILIDNQTGATITIFLTGPAKFGFYLQNGVNIVSVCSGSYSYTAYGCGGKYLNGEIKSHTAFGLYCGG